VDESGSKTVAPCSLSFLGWPMLNAVKSCQFFIQTMEHGPVIIIIIIIIIMQFELGILVHLENFASFLSIYFHQSYTM
jgi:hypothetical protein